MKERENQRKKIEKRKKEIAEWEREREKKNIIIIQDATIPS